VTEIPRIAVCATHNRPAELARLLDAIAPQCHAVVVVDNASDPPVNLPTWWPSVEPPWTGAVVDRMRVHVIRDEEQPPNLSRLWNVGIDHARSLVDPLAGEPYDVAVLNDDAVPPPGWWDAVSTGMRAAGAAAACSDPYGTLTQSVLKVTPDADIMARMTGWAFMLAGEKGLRLDEDLRWWWGDTQLDWDARRAGGMLVIPGYRVENTGANSSTTGELALQAGLDRATFKRKNGWNPW
jgi:glycosyltransferase involved in cell wall biosynthesis